MVLCAGLGLFTGLACVAFLIAATMGSGPYMVQGAAVSREEFMAFAAPTLLGQAALSAFAVAAARALVRHSTLDTRAIVEQAMSIAAGICIYTNDRLVVEELST